MGLGKVPLELKKESSQKQKHFSHSTLIPNLSEERQGFLIAGTRPGVLALRPVQIGQSPEGPTLAILLTQSSVERDTLLQHGTGLSIISALSGIHPQQIQTARDPCPVFQSLAEYQGLPRQ